MKIAYIILAHKYPEQITRLVQRLADADTSFFIHIDWKAGKLISEELVAQLRNTPNVHFVKRHSCRWGRFSIVDATIEGISQLLNSGVDFDYAMLLSGQDYLIKPNSYIKDFLQQNYGQEFIEYFALAAQNKWTDCGGMYQALNRVQYWHLRFRSKHLYLKIKRKFPANYQPYGGSQWWCLSKDCLSYINSVVRDNSQFVHYFRHVFIPDECFFQTIISNSRFKECIFNDDLRYADWENANPFPPAILDESYFDKLKDSPKLFARKFDISRNVEILNLIDEKILGVCQ